MLEELQIRNWALIDRLSIRFGGQLCVLSGETGAGKSILIDAISLLLGLRADTGSISDGCEEALVMGLFSLPERGEPADWLAERGIVPDDGTVMIRRIVKRSGRGSIYLQAAPVTRAELTQFSSLLVDLHGQHQHQSLFNITTHRRLLDRHAKLETQVSELAARFGEWTARKARYDKLLMNEQDRLRQVDLLQFAVREIEEARLKEGEEEQLNQELRVLEQHETLSEKLEAIHSTLAENRGGAVALLRNARRALEQAVAIDTELSEPAQRLNDLFYELEDISQLMRDRIDGFQFSPERLSECQERLALIRRLQKKYGATEAAVLEYCREGQQQLDDLSNWEDDTGRLRQEIQQLERQVLELAERLSQQRKRAAGEMAQRIEAVLRTLGMSHARFEVAVERRRSAEGKPVCGHSGIDEVFFRIGPNVGMPLKPLKQIASGGEISRVMLAIKTVLVDSDTIDTLIFDEIDVGIGGEAALAVGKHLKQLATHKQVFCITHLASIAARADNHYVVAKSLRDDRTFTGVQLVKGAQRVEEIARMLAGDRRATVSQEHAETLLRQLGGA